MTKICKDCKVYKSLDEFYNVKIAKDGKHTYCKVCMLIRCKNYRDSNAESVRFRKSRYSKSDAGKLNKKLERQRNRTTYSEFGRKHYINNKTKLRESNNLFFVNNPHKRAEYSANRRAYVKLRSPKWLSEEDKLTISSIYKECKMLSESTGIPHEVDHIVPINGKEVSELHVPWNLQILTQIKNREKSSKLEVPN